MDAAAIEPSATDIGERIRQVRLSQNLSLRKLAEKANVSPSLLCEVENGKVQPSVRTILRVADALAIGPDYFLAGATPSSAHQQTFASGSARLLKAAERPRIFLADGIRWEGLTPGKTAHTQFFEIMYPAGATSGEEMMTHAGTEFGVVLEGQLTIDLAFDRHVLEAGDSIHFESTTPHRLTNCGTVSMRAMWVDLLP